jgi:abhydrolase domain-containing protein 17
VLVMHGALDAIIPLGHGERLFAAAREPKRLLVIDEAGHNDFTMVAGERQGRALREFAALLSESRTAAR